MVHAATGPEGADVGCAEPDDFDVRIGSREAERVSVSAAIDAIYSNVTALVCLHDLPTTGARIEARQTQFVQGQVVRLRLPFLPAESVAEIAWARGTMAGVRFNQPLDRPTFQILTKAMQVPKDRRPSNEI